MYRSFLTLSSLLPLPLARGVGRRLGGLYYKYGKKKPLHIARVNMEICYPQLSPPEREERVRRSLMEAGVWIMEAGAIWMWSSERILKHVTVKNPELFEQALANNKGVILAIPHLGNWEVMGPYVSRQNEFACFYKHNDKSPRFSRFVHRQRSRNGTVMATTDRAGIRCLYKHLRAGKVVGLLPDHNPTEEMGVFAPFFGKAALTGTLISSLARKNKAQVLTAAAIRTTEGFEIHFGRVENQHSEDPLLAATSLNSAIERCIALAPEQFQWVYPRFKKRRNPDKVQSPYRLARS
ncbi:MAG: lysophospholipid acyltransferase family protein [Cellvibrionaceae bacterium]